ncbi:MAG: hypothetical protein P8M30_16685 [Planctomycetaceae bacterium]|jgi:hypothetical protein|nr:hypothetical protein [Planctomycetaceae bacterium]MDB4786693.1 hypothetical protein [Planctomycetaceae bacterium]MDC0273147.1 hypothetical protein [Planctomycetaceae bacterium]MDG2390945.1 hypothetical protein [Planctomycetaceae bacterium]
MKLLMLCGLLCVPSVQIAAAEIECEGSYKHHLQGVCVDDDHIYWSFTTALVKTDRNGKLIKSVPVVNHHGDLCHVDGKLYVAVNLGDFNNPKGNADSWVYQYDSQSLNLLKKYETQEVFYGAGGMDARDGHFFVVGGLPDGVQENYVYEYDQNFQFVQKHIIASGHTFLGIQSAAFHEGRWYFGCYGKPSILLVTNADFKMIGRYEYNCSLGIVGIAPEELLSASGSCSKDKGCTGKVRLAVPDMNAGLKITD